MRARSSGSTWRTCRSRRSPHASRWRRRPPTRCWRARARRFATSTTTSRAACARRGRPYPSKKDRAMTEPRHPFAIVADDEAELTELLRAAGPRPALPAADLEALRAAAAQAWQAQWRARARRRLATGVAGGPPPPLFLAPRLPRLRGEEPPPPGAT